MEKCSIGKVSGGSVLSLPLARHWLNVTNFQVLLAKADVQLLSNSQ